ncbi:hypothetical protein VPHD292_0064 [Vibrio phage D292]
MTEVHIHVDPTQYYLKEGVDYNACLQACGLLPSFIDPESDELLIDQLRDNYGFPTADMTGLVVEKVYTNQHARDEDLYPYVEITSGSESVFIYPYAIVASVLDQEGENTQVITRMD